MFSDLKEHARHAEALYYRPQNSVLRVMHLLSIRLNCVEGYILKDRNHTR